MEILNSEENFLKLMPLVLEFSMRTRTNPSEHLHEVILSMQSGGRYLTSFVLSESGEAIRYFCGYFLDREGEFLISQAFSKDDPNNSLGEYSKVEAHLRSRGVQKLLLQTHLNPLTFRRYGFRVERFLLSKEIDKSIEMSGTEEAELSQKVERDYFLSLFKEHLSKVKSYTSLEIVLDAISKGECPFLGLRACFKGDQNFREMRRYYLANQSSELTEKLNEIVKSIYTI